MKKSFLNLLVFCFFFIFPSFSFGSDPVSQAFNNDSLKAEIISLKESIMSFNNSLIGELNEKGQENQSHSGSLSTISIVFTILISLITLVFTILISLVTAAFGYITYLAKRDRDDTNKVLKELQNSSKSVDKRLQSVLKQTDHYLDSILVTFNELLPESARIKIELLKYVLYLRHYDETTRFAAIKSLGQSKDETVIPHLKIVAETDTDPELRKDAQRAIEDIKRRITQKPASNP